MTQVLRDSHGHKIGEIQESCGKKIIRDEHGHKLGEFDGRVTRDEHGRLVGSGDLLTSLDAYWTMEVPASNADVSKMNTYVTYIKGTNEDYENLLDYVDSLDNVTNENLYYIAKDIIKHSDTDKDITSVMFDLAKKCSSFFDIVEY